MNASEHVTFHTGKNTITQNNGANGNELCKWMIRFPVLVS